MIKQTAVLFGLILFLAAAARAGDYAVRKDGGGDFTTIQACANAAAAGDTCLIHNGAYAENVTVGKNNMTLKNASGQTPLITGSLSVGGTQDVTIEGLEVAGFADYGIYQAGGAGLTIRNCTVRDGTGEGIYSRNSTRLAVLDNDIHGATGTGIVIISGHSTDGTYGNGILLSGNDVHDNGVDGIEIHGQYITIDGNFIHENIDANWAATHPDGIQLIAGAADGYTAAQHVRITNNVIRNHTQNIFSEGTAGGPSSDCSDIHIYNNVVYNESAVVNGVSMDAISASNLVIKFSKDVHIYNNYIGRAGNNAVYVQGSYDGTIHVKNNIVHNTLRYGIYSDSADFTAGELDYNIYSTADDPLIFDNQFYGSLAVFKSAFPAQEIHGLSADPLVNALPSPTLQSASPAINAGVNLTSVGSALLNADKTGAGRPASGAWDIGAYEYVPVAGERHVGPGQTFSTIQSCLDAAQAGETCVVHAGSYTEQLSLPRSGTQGNPITLRSNEGDAVTVQSAQSPVVNVNGRSDWVISGMEFVYNGAGAGPTVIRHGTGAGFVDRLSVLNSTLTLAGGTGNGFGMYIANSNALTVAGNVIRITAAAGSHDGADFLYSSNLTFSGNTVSGNASESTGTLEDGLVVSGTDITIENNVLRDGWSYDNHPDGIVVQGDGDRAGQDTEDVRVLRNTVINFTQGIYFDAIHNPLGGDNLIANNVVYETSGYRYGGAANKMNAIVLDGENISGAPFPVNARVYNNTLASRQIQLYVTRTSNASNIEIYNNLFVSPPYTAVYIGNTGGVTMDYGYYSQGDATPIRWGSAAYSLSSFRTAGLGESHGAGGNADLNADFTPKAASDSVGRGMDGSAYFTNDRLGVQRPQGAGWDIGAYEYDSGTSSPGSVQVSEASFSGNENAGVISITATRTGGSAGAVGVSYATSNGTAQAGSDYAAVSGTLSWADGDSAAKTITVNIADDALVEGTETFTITLSTPTGGAALGAVTSATVNILDDEAPPDATPPTNPKGMKRR